MLKQNLKLLTCQMAAKHLGFTSDYIRRLCWEGKIFATKIGTDWLIPVSSLKNLKRKRTKKELENGSGE